MARAYSALAIVGAFAPGAAFAPWVQANGIDPLRFAVDLFANRVSSFFALDVIVSAIVLILFVIVQGARDCVTARWWAILATCVIGVSCGLPLFLALRERALVRRSGSAMGGG